MPAPPPNWRDTPAPPHPAGVPAQPASAPRRTVRSERERQRRVEEAAAGIILWVGACHTLHRLTPQEFDTVIERVMAAAARTRRSISGEEEVGGG